MFTAALFTTAKTRKQPKCPSTDEWIKKVWYLEWWDREGGREGDARGKRYGNICICITDSLCYKAETDTPL